MTKITVGKAGSATTTSAWQHSAPGFPPSSGLCRDVEKSSASFPSQPVWWEQQCLPHRLTVITTKRIAVLGKHQGTAGAYLLLFPIFLPNRLLGPPAVPAQGYASAVPASGSHRASSWCWERPQDKNKEQRSCQCPQREQTQKSSILFLR